MIAVEKLFDERMMIVDLEVENKEEALEKVSKLFSINESLVLPEEINVQSVEEVYDGFLKSIKEREKVFSTAVGYNFAIPHCKTNFVKKSSVAYAKLKKEIAWSKEEIVRHIFMIGVPEKNAGDEHLEIFIKLAKIILEDDFRAILDKTSNKNDILKLLIKYEKNRE